MFYVILCVVDECFKLCSDIDFEYYIVFNDDMSGWVDLWLVIEFMLKVEEGDWFDLVDCFSEMYYMVYLVWMIVE